MAMTAPGIAGYKRFFDWVVEKRAEKLQERVNSQMKQEEGA
jgi:hypothetical protein